MSFQALAARNSRGPQLAINRPGYWNGGNDASELETTARSAVGGQRQTSPPNVQGHGSSTGWTELFREV
ncbi:flagellar basal body rod protein FlgB [Anopheles sinensis]|uniref:Flagellar basal body rod protein FlgB n=1 Tax=Anopheles sinensis TaxID=74873 RepID=A0A084VBA3_ANOSI|nr:flagellar basal body rod protein FlgB [Anopheles sinensis]